MNRPLKAAIAVALASGAALAAQWTQQAAESSRTTPSNIGTDGMAVTSRSDTSSSTASRQGPKPAPLVKLDFEMPKYKPDTPLGLMFSSGWPLVIRAAVTPDALGIVTNQAPSEFPTIGETGYVLLADPDNCLELPAPYFRGPAEFACSNDPSDETYVEFTNDVDQVGVVDEAGNPHRGAALASPAASGQPGLDHIKATYEPNNPVPILSQETLLVGAPTGGNVADGYGYGADDDLPGLVLLSPTGTGLVLGADFNPPYVRQQRNLAGFLNSVAYELRDPTGSTAITASMVMPQSLVAPLMQLDDCVGAIDPVTYNCAGESMYRVDGGPLQSTPTTIQTLYPAIFQARTYELRAFLVSGTAPSVLADMNADGKINAADATSAGYNVLSNEAVVRLRQYHGDICGGVGFLNVVMADFDNNGRILSFLVCPGGPGQLTKIPQ